MTSRFLVVAATAGLVILSAHTASGQFQLIQGRSTTVGEADLDNDLTVDRVTTWTFTYDKKGNGNLG